MLSLVSRGTTHWAQGFSLVELLVVVAIVSVLSTIGLPLAELSHKRAQEEELRVALRQIRAALDEYKTAVNDGHVLKREGDSGYPPDLATLVRGVPDAKSLQGGRLYFLRRIPRDPFASASVLLAEDTWALRSYISPADSPAPGRDVYDVYSKSTLTGLNGVRYRDW